MQLKDQVAIVTGGASLRGIGWATAKRFADEGATVVLIDLDANAAAQAAKAIGAQHMGLACDVRDEAACRATVQRVMDALGRIDVLINNAGVFENNPLDQSEADWTANWERTMQINLTSSAILCRRAVLHWQENKAEGRIVNIASRAAYRGDSPQHWHYAASKAGMVGMTKSIARAYAAQGILAFAICPGFTMTGMADDYLASRGGDKLLADIPLGRVAMPDEVAELAAFCALSAPPSMTGAVLDINGASYVR